MGVLVFGGGYRGGGRAGVGIISPSSLPPPPAGAGGKDP